MEQGSSEKIIVFDKDYFDKLILYIDTWRGETKVINSKLTKDTKMFILYLKFYVDFRHSNLELDLPNLTIAKDYQSFCVEGESAAFVMPFVVHDPNPTHIIISQSPYITEKANARKKSEPKSYLEYDAPGLFGG